ncbi:14502_t:CDS:2 [Rhizophagus irregularis]|nr:14502_t:CDS:2 [Rhizophagus irregularis]
MSLTIAMDITNERPSVESLYPTIFHISCQQPWSYIWHSTSSSSFTPKLVVPPAHSFTDAITIRLAHNDKYVISQLKLNKQVVVDTQMAKIDDL